jgi:peroxiredoxin
MLTMKLVFKFTLLCLSLLTFLKQEVCAQGPNGGYQKKIDSVLQHFGKESSFVLKGAAKNFKGKFFEFGLTGFTDDQTYSVMVNDDGSFEQKFPINYVQQLFLLLNDEMFSFSINANDTLVINWDQNNIKESFKILSKNQLRHAQLQVELGLNQLYNALFVDLLQNLSQNKATLTAEQKFKLINDQFNERVRFIINSEKKYPELTAKGAPIFNEIVVNDYYNYAELLRREDLLHMPLKVMEDESFSLPKKEMTLPDGKKQSFAKYGILSNRFAYKTASEMYLIRNPAYRKFLYNYIRLGKQLVIESSIVYAAQGDVPPRTNFILKGYYHAKSSFSSPLLLDWFTSNLIRDAFVHEDFTNVENVYRLFSDECKTPYFKAFLERNYASVKNLKPGQPAPNFTLKDSNGKTVSLTDFKGKVVYLDFWGLSCGPCIYEFENHTAKLKEKYKDAEIVFMYICVDGEEKEWKKGIKKYNLEGINLIAEGWAKNPVCQIYNVMGIPRYVVINQDGTMANQSAARPSELLRAKQSEIDVALKKL